MISLMVKHYLSHLQLSNNLISILSSKGSNINVQDTLLMFINDILQVPGGRIYLPWWKYY